MTLEEFASALETLGLPVAYDCIPELQKMPYLIWFCDTSDSITANGIVILTVEKIEVHLITAKRRILSYEDQLEKLFDSLQIAWNRSYDEDRKQNIYDTFYAFTLEIPRDL